ncbi:flagellar hook-associated protein FlgK [Ureibacillus thermosphaericus]|uniref:flagellar hook-associated protein FlgK n=1 Tax=Ureibacillus thermosphaericus TaxID=51173 RepID=UPI0030CA119D
MRSTFMGLEANKRGLFTQQSALYTTGHNIANANTEGYSRQRVNMSPTLGYPGAGLNAPMTAGYIGTGVKTDSVQRIRDEFIDRQYRQETNKLGYWESKASAINQMEDIMSEPSEYGLDEAFRMFWSALQDVGANPEDTAARKAAVQRAIHLADSFNYIDTQLKQIQGNLGNEIKVSVEQINSLLQQIADLNRQIQAVEPNGYVPNDLYDKRDVLVDELNEYIPVSIQRVPSGGNASEVAEGSYTITFKPVGKEPIILVHGREFAQLSALGTKKVTDPNDSNSTIPKTIDGNDTSNLLSHLKIEWAGSWPNVPTNGDGDPDFNQYNPKEINLNVNGKLPALNGDDINQFDFEPSKGKLLSLIDSYGYIGTTRDVEGYYPQMIEQLDKLAEVFASAFNEQHRKGFTLEPSKQGTFLQGTFFFLGEDEALANDYPGKITAASIKVNDKIIDNPSLVAASTVQGEEGNGNNALKLSNLHSESVANVKVIVDNNGTIEIELSDLEGATFQSFYQGLIGQLGVDGQKATLLQKNTETIRLTVENNRASMSSVSLDEEMTDMIRFQQAYNANARMITVIDETLDKIINGMGRVGL